MNLRDLTAHVLIKNEEYYIRSVLKPLVKHLGRVLVFDTGSTDDTVNRARGAGAEVHLRIPNGPSELGQLRNEMIALTETPWVFLCDGDELYPEVVFEQLAQQEMPEGKKLGFTPMASVKYIDGQYWVLGDKFSRVAVYPRQTAYRGEYPFEVPSWFDLPETYHYFKLDLAYHLHPLIRSSQDDNVYMRPDKRDLFSLQRVEVPAIETVILPLVDDPYGQVKI